MAGSQKVGTTQTIANANYGAITAANAVAAQADYDNTSGGGGLDQLVNVVFEFSTAAALAAGDLFNLYMQPKYDGTNAADLTTGGTPKFQADHYAGSAIAVLATTGPHRLTFSRVALGPYKYTPVIENTSSKNVSSGGTMKIYPYDDV